MKDVPLTQSQRGYHDFLRAAKLHWSREMYGALRQDFANRGLDAVDVDAAETAMRESTLYKFFGWFERNLQKEKYESQRGILAIVEPYREELKREIDAAATDGIAAGLLRLDADFEQPAYYRNTDFHQHPGGVWSDEIAGVAYEIGRQTTMPMNVDPYGVHDLLARRIPKGKYQRILDIGCGTGRSTLPFAKVYPGAELYGIDLSAPCLKLAHLHARERGVDAHWSQQRCEATDFPDGSFDLIHSTFLLHELPPKAIAATVREAARLLAPGGVFAHLDFHSPPGGTWGQFIHYGHGRRNNEVFMRPFCEMDFLALEKESGFSEAAMTPFDDGTGLPGKDGIAKAWRFPFQLLVARKA
ncbi:MAG: methyltransferase domain-containing protein [Rhodobacteraceae bacterium]|nr:methyltransferase domain-containing protein [Paracoccaceae bacterium]